jgi:hypothetical protein
MASKIKLTAEICGHCFSRLTERDVCINRMLTVFGKTQVQFRDFVSENDDNVRFSVICDEKDFPEITTLLEGHLSVISYSWKVLEEEGN